MVWPEGLFNNELGLPPPSCESTKNSLPRPSKWALEVLVTFRSCARSLWPDAALCSIVGFPHGSSGQLENTARAKAELIEALEPQGVAVLQCRRPICLRHGRTDASPDSVVGSGTSADVQVIDVVLDDLARPHVTLRIDDETQELTLALTRRTSGDQSPLPLRQRPRRRG